MIDMLVNMAQQYGVQHPRPGSGASRKLWKFSSTSPKTLFLLTSCRFFYLLICNFLCLPFFQKKAALRYVHTCDAFLRTFNLVRKNKTN